MKIREAFPHVFQRAYPLLDPKMPMLPAVSMLRFQQIDGLPLILEARGRPRALHGYSLLKRLLTVGPNAFWEFLEKPCEEAAQGIATVDADQDVEDLLNTFIKERFGFAWISDSRGMGVPVSLADLLELYESETFRCDLQMKDVGSPIFSLPGMTPLRQALLFMFSHRFRRVFLANGDTFISDRSIISHLFSPASLQKAAKGSYDALAMPMAEVEQLRPRRVPGRTTMRAAAHSLNGDVGQCLTSRGLIASAWDLVIKPWNQRAITLAE